MINVLRHWLEDHWPDFETHPALLYQLIRWIDQTLLPSGMVAMANSLQKTMTRKLETEDLEPKKKLLLPPTIVIPKRSVDFLELDNLELARQLCLYHQRLYCAINLREFLDQKWTKDQKEIVAPGIVNFIKDFNDLSNWVCDSIVIQLNLRKRGRILEKWIGVAMRCRELRNFNAVMAIISGLRSSPVFRLRKTWARLDSKTYSNFDQLKDLMSSDGNWQKLSQLSWF